MERLHPGIVPNGMQNIEKVCQVKIPLDLTSSLPFNGLTYPFSFGDVAMNVGWDAFTSVEHPAGVPPPVQLQGGYCRVVAAHRSIKQRADVTSVQTDTKQ